MSLTADGWWLIVGSADMAIDLFLYASLSDAMKALLRWDGDNDPTGWTSHAHADGSQHPFPLPSALDRSRPG